MRLSTTLILPLVLALAAAPTWAQGSRERRDSARAEAERDRPERDRADRGGERRFMRRFEFGAAMDRNRAMLGVGTSSSGVRDTLGLLISSITPGGPAEKAGLEEGNRIDAVNGVNLRLAAADAGERDMSGLTTRRLVRELGRVKPGGEVELRVYADGRLKTVKVKTVAADSLRGRRMRLTRDDMDDRAVLGLNLGGGGSRRDTLGVLIVRVETDGPAEKAGIVEGDRVVAINGADLRVAREDAGDEEVSGAKSSRFRREMRKVKVGDRVQLRVYSGGQVKTVQVTAARAADVYKDRERGFFIGDAGEGFGMPPMPPMPPLPGHRPRPMLAPMPAMPPMPPEPPEPPEPPMSMSFEGAPDDGDFDVEVHFDTDALRSMGERIGTQVHDALHGVELSLPHLEIIDDDEGNVIMRVNDVTSM